MVGNLFPLNIVGKGLPTYDNNVGWIKRSESTNHQET